MKRNDSPSGRFGARMTVLVICLALLWLPYPLVAQPTQFPLGFARIGTEEGLPIIRNYTPKEYGAGPQNLGIKQDSRGVLYIANYNDRSILAFDGATWRRIKIPGGFFPNRLAIDENDRVYVAAIGEFGVMRPDSTGILRFHSLLQSVKPGDRQFSRVGSLHATAHGIYLQTPERLFRWHSDTVKVWKPRTVFSNAFLVRDKFYVYEDGLGVLEMTGDSLRMVAGTEKFLNMPVGAMFPFHYGRNKSILMGIAGEGLFTYNGVSLQPFPGEASETIRQYGIRCSAVLDDSTFAIATSEMGVVIFDDMAGFYKY